MKKHLIELFQYNLSANKKLLTKILQLPDKTEPVKLFSHLINCQYKWLARIIQKPKAHEMSWWEPVYEIPQLEDEWEKSTNRWLDYIEATPEETLYNEVQFIGFDGGIWAAKPKDIALQLNFHSIHHRAQIQTMIRHQGLEPDFLDYIGTRYRRISD